MAEVEATEELPGQVVSESLAGPSNYNTTQSATEAPSSPSTDFSSSLFIWREVNLPALQHSLGTLCPTLVNSQKDALLSRKKLAEQTREFRKLDVEGQTEAIKPLLKSYQSEIDSLTKRAKSAENAVLSVRDRLQAASDPYPILEAVLEQTATLGDLALLKEQVEQLSSTNASLEIQLKTLPSLESERIRLTNRITQLEGSLESRISESRKIVEAESSAKWDERIRNHQTREKDLQKSLESTQSQLKEIRGNYSKVTERLLQHGEEVEREHTNGKIEELEMISEELSRSNERVGAMERRNEQLRQEIERLKNGVGEQERRREADSRQSESEEENKRLNSLLEEESQKALRIEDEMARKVKELEAQAKEKDKESDTLRRRLHTMDDYDEIKRELEIFKYVEFAVEADRQMDGDVDDDDKDKDRNEVAATSTSAKPLEALLIEKNRQLQNELTNIRVAKTKLDASSEQTKRDLDHAKSEMLRLKNLNERLEDDMINLKPTTQNAGKGNMDATMSAEEALLEMDKIGKEARQGSKESAATDNQVSSMQTPIPFQSTKGVAGVAEASKVSGNDTPSSSSSSGILPIITSQRDRFRARNVELEEELRKQFESITELRSEVKTLQSDNLSLYEKVRYLQAYGSSASNSQNYRGPGGGSRIISVAAQNDPGSSYPPNQSRGEDKYRDKYEAAMNPFEQFRGREQSRVFNSLNPLERVLHMLTRLILGHRRMRIFFIVYAISLHILVFAMLFEIEFYNSVPIGSLREVQPAQAM
ncbi:hypothetical protein CBS101457_001847 [Exobasidium rhododendri]|nr:hypothetical protein CBS101457_001847 [Exobasidium rhododendri]